MTPSSKTLVIVGFCAATACLLTVAVYWAGLSGGYALDDFTNIVQNDALAVSSLSWDELSRAAFSFQAGPTMRPVSMLSFALNRYLSGSDPYYFKVTNLTLHIINGLLVFTLLWQLLEAHCRRLATPLSADRAMWLALVIGSLWMLHPLNFLPVLYVVQRETILSALFVLVGVNLYLWVRSWQSSGRAGTWLLWLGMPLFTLLAVLSKESGALLPVYLLVLETLVFRFRDDAGDLNRQSVAFFVMMLVLPACAGLSWMLLAHHGAFLSYANRDFTLGQRLMSETRILWSYIQWTLAPNPSTLGLYHDDIAVSTDLLHPQTTLPAIVGLMSLMGMCVAARRRLPLLSLGIAWFLGGQLLESTIFPLELAYEHRNYLPDLGLLLAVVSLVFPLSANAGLRLPRYTLLAMALALFSNVTWQRARDWSDNLTFAETEAANHPGSPYATYTLGQIYTNMALFGHPELYPQAVKALAAAAALPASGVIPDVSLVLLESQITGSLGSGDMDRIRDKLGQRRLSASDLQALNALVDCVDKKNCRLPMDDMPALFDAALTNPNLSGLPSVHADLLVMYGNYIQSQQPGQVAQARELMAQATVLVPTEPQYRANLVTMDISMRDAGQAERDLQALRALNYLGHLDAQIAGFDTEIASLAAKSDPSPAASP